MGIYRHDTVLLNRTEAAAADARSGPFVVRPTDGDAANDHAQSWVLVAFVDQQGAGQVVFEFLTSFGDGLWIVLARRTLTADGAHLMMTRTIDGFAPYVQVRVVASPSKRGKTKPKFRVIARLASDSPYRAVPAKVASTLEVDATDQDIHHPPPARGQ